MQHGLVVSAFRFLIHRRRNGRPAMIVNGGMRQWHGKTCGRRSALLFRCFSSVDAPGPPNPGPGGFSVFARHWQLAGHFINLQPGRSGATRGKSCLSLAHGFDLPREGKAGRLALVRDAAVRSVGPVLVGAYHGVVDAKIAVARVPETRMKNFPLSSLESGTYSLISSLPPLVCKKRSPSTASPRSIFLPVMGEIAQA